MEYEVVGHDEDGDPIEQFVAAPRQSLGRYQGEGESGLRYAESCDGRSCGEED